MRPHRYAYIRDYRSIEERVRHDPYGWRQYAQEIEAEVKKLEDAGVEIKQLPEPSPAPIVLVMSLSIAIVTAFWMSEVAGVAFTRDMVHDQLTAIGTIASYVLYIIIGCGVGLACIACFILYDYHYHNNKWQLWWLGRIEPTKSD